MRASKTRRFALFYVIWSGCGNLISYILLAMLWMLPLRCLAAVVNATATEGQVVAHLQDKRLDEVSGMATASDGSGHLWMINDGGSGSTLYRVNGEGKVVQLFDIAKSTNRDWEDLEIFTWHKQSFLLIADIGDNGADRSYIEMVVVGEPNLTTQQMATSHKKMQLLPFKMQRFRYPQGARDCEALAVDVAGDKIYLLTKRTQPAQLYSTSLSKLLTSNLTNQSVVTLTLEVELPNLSVPVAPTMISSFFQFVANWPTAMSIAADQQRAAILTYGFLYLYQRQPSQSWLQAFAKPVAVHALSQLPQAESVAFVGKDQVWIASEGEGTPILSWRFSSP